MPTRSGPSSLLILVAVAICLVLPASAQAGGPFVYTVNSSADTDDGACNNAPDCTLREAINAANTTLGLDEIRFNLVTPSAIKPLTALPAITDRVTLDAETQPGFSGTPLIVLDGSLATGAAYGLKVTASPGITTIRGLQVFSYTSGSGIQVTGGTVWIEGNYIGNDGATAFANSIGIDLQSNSHTVGGPDSGDRNVISGNTVGVQDTATGNVIANNLIGPDSTGTFAISNGTGVLADGTDSTLIGSSAAQERNVISGNFNYGVEVKNGSTNVQVLGNRIGTSADGLTSVGNTVGVRFDGVGADSTIGGPNAGEGNLISGNGTAGVQVLNNTVSTSVKGNRIGTNEPGTAALHNGDGVQIGSSNSVLVGGDTAGSGNVLSGNFGYGVFADGSSNLVIQGNLIGTNAAGTAALGNLSTGIYVANSTNFDIGGTTAGSRNVVADNNRGIILTGDGAGHTINGNFIGTLADGSTAAGNKNSGIEVSTNFSTVGVSRANVVANTLETDGNGQGITVEAGNVTIGPLNSIHDNDSLGIDLERNNTVETNDPLDADNGGFTALQNFPVVDSITATTVSGTLDSEPSMSYRVEVFSVPSCDPSGNGEGQTHLGGATVQTNAAGTTPFQVSLSSPPPSGFVTATATNEVTNETSEFSACRQVTDVTPPETAIDSGPSGLTNQNSPAFGFSSSEGGSTFACSVDGGGFTACSSPQTVGPLGDGAHTFAVRATDPGGNEDPTPASRSFTVDTTPPDTIIASGLPTITLASTEPGSSFECRFDAAAFSACAASFTPTLAEGTHAFQARATDAAGNTDPTPASRELVVDPVPELAKSVLVDEVSGRVLVKLPGSSRFVALDELTEIPNGAVVDTRRGKARLQTAPPRGSARGGSGVFNGGIFKVTQQRSGLTQLELQGGSFKNCPSKRARASARPKRRLFSDARGRFRTKGRYSSATVRGTKWEMQDLCEGTLTRVTAGSVTVRDNVRRRNVVVRRGKSYLARARGA